MIACLAAAIWLLHPLHVSTVLYTVQRMAQLSALFSLVTLLLYSLGRDRQIAGSTAWPFFVLVAPAALAAYVMTMNQGLRVQSRKQVTRDELRAIVDTSLSMGGLAA